MDVLDLRCLWVLAIDIGDLDTSGDEDNNKYTYYYTLWDDRVATGSGGDSTN
jgi:hypothetical protein